MDIRATREDANQVKLSFTVMVSLAYAFLLSLLDTELLVLRTFLLAKYCHRTGKRYREAKTPLYRLRAAISRLWQDFPESRLTYGFQSSG